jgi:hypothetical protein
MIKTKIGRAAGFGAAAIVAALGFATAVLAPTPAEARVFVGFGFGFPIIRPTLIRQLTTRHRRPTTHPRPLIRRPGLQISRQAVMLPPDLRGACRSPTPRGAAGQTRKVNIAGNTGPPGPRAIV